MANLNMQKYIQNFLKLNMYFKTENCKCANSHVRHLGKKSMRNFLAKIVQSSSFCSFKAFQKAIKSLNPITGSRSIYRVSGKGKIRHSGSMPEDSGSR